MVDNKPPTMKKTDWAQMVSRYQQHLPKNLDLNVYTFGGRRNFHQRKPGPLYTQS